MRRLSSLLAPLGCLARAEAVAAIRFPAPMEAVLRPILVVGYAVPPVSPTP